MSPLDFLALVLATGGAVDVWRNGSIFARPRRALAGWTLFGCALCLNYQVPGWLLLICYVPSLWLPTPWDIISKLWLYSLAAGYAAWMIHEHRDYHGTGYDRSAGDPPPWSDEAVSEALSWDGDPTE
jgi:hypothetical protein